MKYSIDLPMLVLSTISVMTCLACKTPAEKSQVATAEMDNEFVRINPLQKTKLLYKGREYRFSAANSYSMLKSRDAADQQFTTMKEMGVNALRMWGFWNGSPESLQPSRGVYNEATWQQLDYVLAQAEERGIKIIMPLANYWDEFGGIVLLNSWAGHPPEQKEYYDREIFYVNANSKQLYRDYVIHMLNRRNTITGRLYKNDPTILMWEPMNEARGRSDSSGQTVAEWLAWASQIIKAEDPHHLIGSGTEGFFKTHANFTSYPWQAAHPKPAVGPKG
ncbi:MAG: cellulase family glycosylhydrolase, partial [Proteobacteria bacterium]|nr:cellulase family glycosylhydrolase [Pseudomonadota bacterium]